MGSRRDSGADARTLLVGAFIAAIVAHSLAMFGVSRWDPPRPTIVFPATILESRPPHWDFRFFKFKVSRKEEAGSAQAHHAPERPSNERDAPTAVAPAEPAPAATTDTLRSPGDPTGVGEGADLAVEGGGAGGSAGGSGGGEGAGAPFRVDPEPTFVVPATLAGGARPKRTTTVAVRAWIDSTGAVTKVEFAPVGDDDKPDRALISAALQAASRWRFHPAREGGRAVASTVLLPFRFDRK